MVESHPDICHEGPEGEYRYNPTLSLISALDEVGDQRHNSIAVPLEKRHFTHYTDGWPQGRSERVWKISPPPGLDPGTAQPVATQSTIMWNGVSNAYQVNDSVQRQCVLQCYQ